MQPFAQGTHQEWSMFASNMRVKSLGLAALIIVFVVLGLPIVKHSGSVTSIAASGAEDQAVRFRWAFGAIVGGVNNPKLKSITEDTILKTGDKFKMMVELKKKCFVYVIYQNAQGEMSILFPYSLGQFTADYEPSKKYYIPRGDAWFQLDDHLGQETFYLLASEERLTEVEYLFNQYETAEPSRKSEIAGQMIAEIHNMEKQHRDLLAGAERPAVVGGVVRGVERAQGQDPSDIATISTEISSADFFSKTFNIQHR
jgi:hypothetical protein